MQQQTRQLSELNYLLGYESPPTFNLINDLYNYFTSDCGNYLKKSLFLVGEIGGNGYNYAFFSGGTIQQVEALVPIVVEAIMKAIIVRTKKKKKSYRLIN